MEEICGGRGPGTETDRNIYKGKQRGLFLMRRTRKRMKQKIRNWKENKEEKYRPKKKKL